MTLPAIFQRELGESDDAYMDRAHQKYLVDLDDDVLLFLGKPLSFKKAPKVDGRSYSFMHCVTRKRNPNDRVFCEYRCARIAWIRYFIENFDTDDNLLHWVQPRSFHTTTKRHVIWHPVLYYAIVIEVRKEYAVLWTTFHTDHPHKVRTFHKEYALYQKFKAEEEAM